MFKAILLEKGESGFSARCTELDEARLPTLESGGVLVQPEWSTVNFKDALALTDRSPVVRRWPMVPGIDGAGTVLHSDHPGWKPGDRFVLNGYGAGETHWGCMAGRARLHGDWPTVSFLRKRSIYFVASTFLLLDLDLSVKR